MDDVQRVLQWLCFSRRPVRLDEIIDALAITPGDIPEFDPDERYADPRDILMRCSSLVSVLTTQEGDILRLAHFSVKEYLVSDRSRNRRAHLYGVVEDSANELIAQTCLAYLLQFKTEDCREPFIIKDYPLAEYAAGYWIDHFRTQKDPDSGTSIALIMELFQTSEETQHVSSIPLQDAHVFTTGLSTLRNL